MKKIIIKYGLIAGVLVSAFMLISMNTLSHCEGNVSYDTSMIIGYASMLIAFSLVFVGIRNYRDIHNQGYISFGTAFKIGIIIVLIASTMYVIAWLIDYFFFIPDFMEKYSNRMINQLRESGVSQLEIQKQTSEMKHFEQMYKKSFFQCDDDLC